MFNHKLLFLCNLLIFCKIVSSMSLRYFSLVILGFFVLTAICQELQAQVIQPGTQTNGSETNNIITAVPFLLITLMREQGQWVKLV